MKIEKLNENQIRCTLTSADLANRKIRLSELAYGTERARNLFQDMMYEAHQQFGFNSDNSPLMVEAIPVAPDSIVLIITKVDDPQELDTRFSKFAPSREELEEPEPVQYSGADDIIGLFQKLYESRKLAEEIVHQNESEDARTPDTKDVDLIRVFSFRTLDDAISSARALNSFFDGNNSLYQTEQQIPYQLVLHQSGYSPEDYNRVCNILSEYGKQSACTPAGEAWLAEHSRSLVRENALQRLATL